MREKVDVGGRVSVLPGGAQELAEPIDVKSQNPCYTALFVQCWHLSPPLPLSCLWW